MSKYLKSDNSIDWEKIKEIICGFEKVLEDIVIILPSGLIKTILTGIVAALHLVCSNIPE